MQCQFGTGCVFGILSGTSAPHSTFQSCRPQSNDTNPEISTLQESMAAENAAQYCLEILRTQGMQSRPLAQQRKPLITWLLPIRRLYPLRDASSGSPDS